MSTPAEARPAPADDVQTAWAQALIAALAEAGVGDVVISPGSRSTPLVLAAHEESRLHCWDVMDERPAAFFALGRGAVSGRPTALICTSGTAAAHYLPAVLEAAMAFTPLLVLTADRPVELVACGANQTIDQLHLFGHHVRGFFDLGRAESTPRARRALRRQVAQAVQLSRAPTPGAVHLNARFAKPLEPSARSIPASGTTSPRPVPIVHGPSSSPPPEAVDALVDALRQARRPLLVAGPAPVGQSAARGSVLTLARAIGAPLLADTTSQLRCARTTPLVASFDALLRVPDFAARHQPDLVVQLGRAPISAAWARWLDRCVTAEPALAHWVVGPHGWQDPESTATALVQADVGATVDAVRERVDRRPDADRDRAWLDAWSDADAIARAETHTALVYDETPSEGEISEGAVARLVVDALGAGTQLALGNSLAVRQVDTWTDGLRHDVTVWHQRGASGIDGLVAGACGAATASRRPTVLLLGDVSFLHDLGGLAVARSLDVPLVVVVVDNGGGRIFEQLPIADHPRAADAMRHWTTPHDADLGAAAQVFGHRYVACGTEEGLRDALASALAHDGATIVHARVPAHGARSQNQALWRAIGAAVETAA